MSEPGRLIMAATTIGGPEDIPARSLQLLRTADLLVFEEDKGARSMLKAAGVHRDYWRLSEHRQEETLAAVEDALRSGQTVSYMSDQGTPGLADPGALLADLAYRLGARVSPIPGPSSVAAALSLCPFPANRFLCAGFPPRVESERQAWLTSDALHATHPVVILDTPYRLKALLASAVQALGGTRRALLALDIGGEREDAWYDQLKSLSDRARLLGEERNFVLVIAPHARDEYSPRPERSGHGRRRR